MRVSTSTPQVTESKVVADANGGKRKGQIGMGEGGGGGRLSKQRCAEGGKKSKMPPSVTHMHTPQQSHKSQPSSAMQGCIPPG